MGGFFHSCLPPCFPPVKRLVFSVHSYETCDSFSQSVSLSIAVPTLRNKSGRKQVIKASSRSPFRGREGRAARRLQSVGLLSRGCYFFSQRSCVMFQTLVGSIGYFKETFLFNELVTDMVRILIKVENVGSVAKT